MRLKINNKLADERLLSIYLFVVYIIVATGIVSGVIVFFGNPLDVRELEARALVDKTIYCLVEQGELTSNLFDDKGIFINDFSIMNYCGFNFKDNTKKYQGEEQYALKVNLYDFDQCAKNKDGFLTCNSPKKGFEYGRDDFFEYCGTQGKKIPKCYFQQIYVLYKDTKYLLELNSAVGKAEVNLRN